MLKKCKGAGIRLRSYCVFGCHRAEFGRWHLSGNGQAQGQGALGAFSDEVDAGSSKKMRPNKMLERRSDSIGSEYALVVGGSRNQHEIRADVRHLDIDKPEVLSDFAKQFCAEDMMVYAPETRILHDHFAKLGNSPYSAFRGQPQVCAFKNLVKMGPVVLANITPVVEL